MSTLDAIEQKVGNLEVWDEFKDIYRLNAIVVPEPESSEHTEELGEWAIKHVHAYFVEVVYEVRSVEVTERVKVHPWFGFGLTDYRDETKTISKKFPVNFRPSSTLPFSGILIEYIPKLENLDRFELSIRFALNKTSIKFFALYAQKIEIDWGQWHYQFTDGWKVKDLPIKESHRIEDYIEEAHLELFNLISEYLYADFG